MKTGRGSNGLQPRGVSRLTWRVRVSCESGRRIRSAPARTCCWSSSGIERNRCAGLRRSRRVSFPTSKGVIERPQSSSYRWGCLRRRTASTPLLAITKLGSFSKSCFHKRNHDQSGGSFARSRRGRVDRPTTYAAEVGLARLSSAAWRKTVTRRNWPPWAATSWVVDGHCVPRRIMPVPASNRTLGRMSGTSCH